MTRRGLSLRDAIMVFSGVAIGSLGSVVLLDFTGHQRSGDYVALVAYPVLIASVIFQTVLRVREGRRPR